MTWNKGADMPPLPFPKYFWRCFSCRLYLARLHLVTVTRRGYDFLVCPQCGRAVALVRVSFVYKNQNPA
jgi:hypothetical protein